jgi:hypothetical protein
MGRIDWVRGVRLSKQEREELHRLLRSGLQPVRTVLRALALRQLTEGQAIRKVAANVGLTPKTLWLTDALSTGRSGTRSVRARPARERRVVGLPQRQRIIALVRGEPPAGRTRWTVRLLAEEAVKHNLVPRGTGDGAGLAGKPRSEAVAGKKCVAWRNWMRNTSPAWKTCWRYEKPAG